MDPLWKQRWLSLALISMRVVLGCVFIFASWHKIVQPAEFARAIANYQLLPQALVNPAALLLPWVELVCGVGLLSGLLRRGSALILSILLLIFITALAISLFRGLNIHCGCFSSAIRSGSNMYMDILLDIALLAMSVVTFIFPGKTRKIGIQPYSKPGSATPKKND